MAAKKSKTQKMKKKWAEMEEEMFQQRDSRNKTLAMETKKDEQLFVVDATATKATTTSPSTSGGGGGGGGGAFLTKKQRARMKTLRVDSILSKEKVEKSYPKPTKHRAVDGHVAVMKKIEKQNNISNSTEKNKNDEETTEDRSEGVSLWEKHFPRATGIARQALKILRPTVDRKHAKPVQVDEAGCSYNPPENLRNEVIMKAAAKEMAKEYKEQLNPVRPPLLGQEADAMRIKELYYETGFGDEDDEDEDDDEEGKLNAKRSKSASNTSEKLNKAARNKRARHQQLQKEIEERKQLKKQRRDLSELKSITKDIAEKEKRDVMKRHRLHLTRKEREETQPRRLGKHRYEENLPEVLFTEQVNGKLRTLQGAHALLTDRLKSYQRRELIEPRKRQIKKKSKMMMKYEPGARGERESENQKEIDALNARIKEKRKVSSI
jgi:nucleolar protein 53